MSIDIRAIPAAFAATSPVITNFLFSGSATTAVPATSASIAQPPAASVVNIVAGSGVTNLVAQVQATQDNSTWTTIATAKLTLPGTAPVQVAVPYLGLRVNVTALAGGNASANLTAGQVPLTALATGISVISNPTLTGVPVPSSFLIQWGIPVILPSSGSIANNGALTLTTALPTTFPNCWMFFPAGAIAAGSAAGVYFVQMTDTTHGTIFNNKLGTAGGPPTIPALPTAFVTTGPGAYTQTTATNPILVSIPIIGGSLGINGAIRFEGVFQRPGNTDSYSNTMYYGGVAIATLSNPGTSLIWGPFKRTMRNLGSQAVQVLTNTLTDFPSDVLISGSATSFLAVNSANDQNLEFSSFISTATDYSILLGVTVEILPSN